MASENANVEKFFTKTTSATDSGTGSLRREVILRKKESGDKEGEMMPATMVRVMCWFQKERKTMAKREKMSVVMTLNWEVVRENNELTIIERLNTHL